ncbi:MAG: AAA family ATPase, partial [Planctomycetes bacterium]|nr:AAA family ATPase [Planctomycetota bacterium]
MDLFRQGLETKVAKDAPLADRMRPRSIAEFVGQEHLLGDGKILQRIIDTGEIPSLILWGPPGCGKTSLARLLATTPGYDFLHFSAVLSGVKEVREAIEHAKDRRSLHGARTILFVDEIHRFNKAQQDAFLPHVESGHLILIGATTENPSFEINSPLLSRCRVLTLMPLSGEELLRILRAAVAESARGIGALGATVEPGALEALSEGLDGDARVALNALDVAAKSLVRTPAADRRLTKALLAEAVGGRRLLYDKKGEEHYNLSSAFIKSMRASDPDAALYWM